MNYDTTEKRTKFLKKKGSIITFKKPFYPNGTANGSRQQIIVIRLNRSRDGSVKIEGNYYDSNWYDNLNDLIDSIDWEWMESAHSD